ncbi:rab2 gtpase, putative [Ichthyophthirius multifiliis]|uniref:Rab2 gtpase, putative n=1 Tax=Ichthyophthirius multifiliis TaxID=5932 RepID=G0R3Q6_ICHMU|nr:rab2 gtpase, putative [Ichthyophthirius multifiliis]EGR27873.1 rab2 gtpase, putative [Ichthyophthirius multifiliis]|eukprot:XP_004027218.1 rab2 gtpase, putative [Ichthyophthirius multifiliis]
MNSYHYLFKFILVGDTGVGKSCILLKFSEERYVSDHDATIGVEFGSKTLEINKQTIRFQIWDTAGQESFRSITKSYYKGSIGVILVFDVNKKSSFDNLGRWLKDIKEQAQQNTILTIVGNKIDIGQNQREVSFNQAQEFAQQQNCNYMECSAKNVKTICVVVIDKKFSCAEALNLIIKNDFGEAIIWNQDTAQFDGIITYSDIVNIILKSYKNAALDQIPCIIKKTFFERFAEFNSQRMVQDFKLICIQLSSQIIYKIYIYQIQLFESKNLIVVSINEKLQTACNKMNNNKIHRIIVIDDESQLVIGILTYKDILLYLIRNLTQDFNTDSLDSNQYDIPISFVLSQIKIQQNILTCNSNDIVYNCFDLMMNKWKISSVPIVDNNKTYIGLIHRRDIIFIWKTQNFQILGKPIYQFLQFLKEEKEKIKLTSLNVSEFFNLNDCVRRIVENLFLAYGNRLISINQQTKQIQNLITLGDLFQYYSQDDQ